MTTPPNHLPLLALMALEEACGECVSWPHPRSYALRSTLAYLFYQSGGQDRSPFDDFWRWATQPIAPGQLINSAAIIRSQNLRAALNGIYLNLGIERTLKMIGEGSEAAKRNLAHRAAEKDHKP